MVKMGKCEEAFELFSEVHKLQLQIFGNDHSLTLTTKNSFASCMLEKGKYQEAFETLSQVNKILIESLDLSLML